MFRCPAVPEFHSPHSLQSRLAPPPLEQSKQGAEALIAGLLVHVDFNARNDVGFLRFRIVDQCFFYGVALALATLTLGSLEATKSSQQGGSIPVGGGVSLDLQLGFSCVWDYGLLGLLLGLEEVWTGDVRHVTWWFRIEVKASCWVF